MVRRQFLLKCITLQWCHVLFRFPFSILFFFLKQFTKNKNNTLKIAKNSLRHHLTTSSSTTKCQNEIVKMQKTKFRKHIQYNALSSKTSQRRFSRFHKRWICNRKQRIENSISFLGEFHSPLEVRHNYNQTPQVSFIAVTPPKSNGSYLNLTLPG